MVIKKYCHVYHLIEMLTKVNELVLDMHRQPAQSNKALPIQVPYLTHTLRAKVRLGKMSEMILCDGSNQ